MSRLFITVIVLVVVALSAFLNATLIISCCVNARKCWTLNFSYFDVYNKFLPLTDNWHIFLCNSTAKFALFSQRNDGNFLYRTYVYGNRRYGYYQPNGYGDQYPGQYQPEQFPGNTGLGDDRFKFDPVSKFFN